MAELTLARLKELLHYDPETGVFTWKVRLANRAPVGAVAGTISIGGYRYIGIGGQRYLAHRLAWFYVHGRWPVGNVDHANRDPDGNWIANLREATQSQNCANTVGHRDSISGLKGVSQKRDKWAARICVRGTTHRLGVFDTPEEAHAAYANAANAIHGEFARTA